MTRRKRLLLFIVGTGACLFLVLHSVDLARDNRILVSFPGSPPVTTVEGFPRHQIDEKITIPTARRTTNRESVTRSSLTTVPVNISWNQDDRHPVLTTLTQAGQKHVPTSLQQTIPKPVFSSSQNLTDPKQARTLKNQSFHKPVQDTPSQTVNKTVPDTKERGNQKTVPESALRGIQETVLDTHDRGIQKPVSDTGVRGILKMVLDVQVPRVQKPVPDNQDREFQKPATDTGVRGIQKTDSDVLVRRVQKSVPDNQVRGIQRMVPDTKEQVIRKPVPGTEIRGIQKTAPDPEVRGIHNSFPETRDQNIQKTAPDTEVQGIRKIVPDTEVRENQKSVPDNQDLRIQKPVLDTEVRENQKPFSETKDAGIQKPFSETKDAGIQKPFPETKDGGIQKTVPDTKVRENQKPVPDNTDRGIQTPFWDTKDHRTQMPVPDPEVREIQKTVPDTEVRENQKPVPDNKGKVIQTPFRNTKDHRTQKPVPDTEVGRIVSPVPETPGLTVKKPDSVTQNQGTPTLYNSVPSVNVSSKGVSTKKSDPTPHRPFSPPFNMQRKVTMGPKQVLMSMNSPIAAAPVQSPKTVRHVLLVSYFRGGSTFVGDLLQQNWKTFYTFEPMYRMTMGVRLNETQFSEAVPFLKDLMYSNVDTNRTIKYLKLETKLENNLFMKLNKFVALICSRYNQLCARRDFIGYLCERAPWRVMKINRLSMDQAGRFVQENPELDIRVLHLVRDPRGIMSSRKLMEWCNTTGCNDSSVLCQEMADDYHSFQELNRQNPDRYFQLRYEDLAFRPVEVSKKMFEVLGLPYTEAVARFLSHNTKATPSDLKDPYSTRRNSGIAASEWRNKLRLEDIKNIQAGCGNVLRNYDYTLINSLRQLTGNPK